MTLKILVLMFGLHTTAALADDVACTKTRWALSSEMPLIRIQNELSRLPRRSLLHIAWGEMLRKDSKNSIAVPLLQYMAGTEEKKIMRGYYKTMLATLIQSRPAAETLKTWPKRPKNQTPTTLTLEQLCSLYEESLRAK